jgi:ubiquinone biosynthesis protein
MAAAPEAARNRALAIFQAGDGRPPLGVGEVRELLDSFDWRRYRPRITRLLLHGSRVLDVVPEEAAQWTPLIHDSLLFFLDHMSDERLLERLVAEANLPRDAPRGDRVLAFIAETPSMQKLAQILARNPALAPDFRAALTRVENGLTTMRTEEVLESIHRELDPAVVQRYQLEFDDHLLAEASVGAVVAASYRDPDTGREERAACKVLKPRAVAALGEDLSIIDGALVYLQEHADYYGIGATPLVDIFKEIREALSREIQVTDERANLIRAARYYADDPEILIPKVLDFSTKNATCMEFVNGEKITEAFVGFPDKRAELARRLSDALTFDVLFSKQDDALFHGDPHAGNVFHVEGGDDPYRIALLDWGLAADFTREQREKMVQLTLGLYLKDAKRLANNADVLVDWSPETEEDRADLRTTIEGVLSESEGGEGMFERLDELITALAREGHAVRYETAIFIKSQLTISGILKELDPDFAQDDYVMGRIQGQVLKELHVHLLRTLWFPDWNSHSYRSMMSNEDVKDVQFHRIGNGFKAVGKGIWIAVSFQWLF